MTNHGIEFTKKKMGLRATVYQISQKKEKKKDGGYDKQVAYANDVNRKMRS